jgi:hypothetical protein
MVRLWPRRRKTGTVTLVLKVDTSGWDEAMRKLNEAAQRAGDGMRRWRDRYLQAFPPAPLPHAFTPDFDLRCTAPGCTLLPEEH